MEVPVGHESCRRLSYHTSHLPCRRGGAHVDQPADELQGFDPDVFYHRLRPLVVLGTDACTGCICEIGPCRRHVSANPHSMHGLVQTKTLELLDAYNQTEIIAGMGTLQHCQTFIEWRIRSAFDRVNRFYEVSFLSPLNFRGRCVGGLGCDDDECAPAVTEAEAALLTPHCCG